MLWRATRSGTSAAWQQQHLLPGQRAHLAQLGSQCRKQRELIDFVAKVIRIRKEEPVFQRRRFLQGRAIHGEQLKDIYWLTSTGSEMTEEDWTAGLCPLPRPGLRGHADR